MIIKIAATDLISVQGDLDQVELDPVINKRFAETVKILKDKQASFNINGKKIAPQANDFLYFSCIMMHAAEAACIDDNGNLKKDAQGNDVEFGWRKQGDALIWQCSDSNLMPYKNKNNDIFPAQELIKAHKKWVGKPLCLDHKSSSVDMVRGLVLDTYYDPKFMRVIALCALDKKNYPDLARKVATGYAHSVSMGTAVGKAVCTEPGCHRVATVESEFCEHMRAKSCYGEVNLDLNPIELSLVVNGADQKAKIKTIIASAQEAMQNYTNLRDRLKTAKVDTDELDSIKKALVDLTEKVDRLLEDAKAAEESEDENESYGVTNSSHEMPAAGTSPNPGYATPGMARLARYASSSVNELVNNVGEKLHHLQTDLEKLSMKEFDMTNKRAYFQGAGGVNEPTPGRPKYEKEDYQTIRDTQDKQMVGQMDTSGPDGISNGYDSFGMSELERKKMLARAEAEERARIRRNALEHAKRGYHQGGGGPNDPKELPYKKEDYESIRDDEDKQMVGQMDLGGPDGFPKNYKSVGGGSELDRKKNLRRASYKAIFVKAEDDSGNLVPGQCRWNVYRGDGLVLSATVDELTKGRSEALFDNIANKKFAKRLLENIQKLGASEVRSRIQKRAQQAETLPGAGPAETPDAGGPAEVPGDLGAMPDMPEMDEPDMDEPDMDEPMDEDLGSPAEEAMQIAEELRDRASDLVEALRALTDEASEMDSVDEIAADEGAPADVEVDEIEAEVAGPEMAKGASTRKLFSMKKGLNRGLIQNIKHALSELKENHEEVSLVRKAYAEKRVNSSNVDLVRSMTKEAFADARSNLDSTLELMAAFVKYARASEAIEKRAMDEHDAMMGMDSMMGMDTDDHDAMMGMDADDHDAMMGMDSMDSMMGMDTDDADDHDAMMGMDAMVADDEHDMNDMDMADDESLADMLSSLDADDDDLDAMMGDDHYAMDENDALDVNKMVQDAVGKSVSEALGVNASDLSTKAGRAANRMKLAQKSMQFSDMIDKAHPGGGTTTQLDHPPADDNAKFETIIEQQEKDMEVATAGPRVRKMAEDINKLVQAGELDPSDVDGLVALGIDQEAVKYYKSYYGQVDKTYADELTREMQKKKAEVDKEKEMKSYRVKLASAYELATDMQARGMIGHGKKAFSAMVDEIMGYDDNAFNSIKRVVANQEVVKNAAVKIPQVGNRQLQEEAVSAETSDLGEKLAAALNNAGRRQF